MSWALLLADKVLTGFRSQQEASNRRSHIGAKTDIQYIAFSSSQHLINTTLTIRIKQHFLLKKSWNLHRLAVFMHRYGIDHIQQHEWFRSLLVTFVGELRCEIGYDLT